jgi:endogenous inhibitor of DNA gyrase (YacG/DUF329 family)
MTPTNHKKRSCSICKKPVEKMDNVFFPFCSEQCKLIDLGNWLGDKYSIEGSDSMETGDDPNDGSIH